MWFAGLSGAGKRTGVKQLEEILKDCLDDDVVQQSLTRGSGVSNAELDRTIERITFVADFLTSKVSS